jgi:hypothetical protein
VINLHIKPSENGGDADRFAKSDAGTVVLMVEFDAEDMGCKAEISGRVILGELGLNFDRSVGRVHLRTTLRCRRHTKAS